MDNEDVYWDDIYYYEECPEFDDDGNLLGGEDDYERSE